MFTAVWVFSVPDPNKVPASASSCDNINIVSFFIVSVHEPELSVAQLLEQVGNSRTARIFDADSSLALSTARHVSGQ